MADNIARLEQRIRELEEENHILNNIIFKAPIPIFVLDSTHCITHFNQALEELSGFRAQDMVGSDQQWKAFYAQKRPVMADLIIENSSDSEIMALYGMTYDKPGAGKDRFAATNFFKDLPPEGRWLYFTASTFEDAKGRVAGAVETLQDVTQEKIKEARIRELYRIYGNILEFIPYPVIVYDKAQNVSYVNPAFTKVFGWALDDLKGRPLDFVPPALARETHDVLNQFMQQKKIARYETQRLTREGQVLDVVIWAATHHQESGTETFVILRDITKEKRLAANNKTIMRISAALPEHPELEDLMDYISQEVKNLLNTEGAVVLLYDEIKNDLFFLGAAYDDASTQKRAKTIRFAMDEVLAGKVLKTGRPAVNNAVDASLRDYPERDRKMGYQTRSLLCVPIRSDSRITGVLVAINKKQNRFDDNDMALMTMIAGTVGLSIENARFSEALKEAYRDVASMNRAKGKAINHLSHELKTPVAVLTGSLEILRKKVSGLPQVKVDATLNRIERNLARIVEIQTETADIMETGVYQSRELMLKMLETCQDELETLIEACLAQEILEPDHLIRSIATLIDREFGPRSMDHRRLDLAKVFHGVYDEVRARCHFRRVKMDLDLDPGLLDLVLPLDVLKKIMEGLIRNAVENTPDQGLIRISAKARGRGTCFEVKDFGVGIEPDHQKRIFEGFFTTQEALLYSTKTPYAFNAGGKGADLLRMKLFADRLGFTIDMTSNRCTFLAAHPNDTCPGDILKCRFCTCQEDCLNSGGTLFSVFFPEENPKT